MIKINYINKRTKKGKEVKVDLFQYVESIGAQIEVDERHKPRTRSSKYNAHIKGCEILIKNVLSGASGDGGTINAALRDLAKNISRQCLVFGAYSVSRREVNSPSVNYKFQKEYNH